MDEETKFSSIGGISYQEKVVKALIQDHQFAEQMQDTISPNYFDYNYLSVIAESIIDYHEKYKTFPSIDVIGNILANNDDVSDVLKNKATKFLEDAKTPLNGDMRYIQDTSKDFCKKRTVLGAIGDCLEDVEKENYDSIAARIRKALAKGDSNDLGHDYLSEDAIKMRQVKDNNGKVKSPWPELNKTLNGGFEKGSITTFIAPTGAGKTHFLTNVSAGAASMGYNAAYISLEIAEHKIGIRHDAYFSGVRINDVPDNLGELKDQILGKISGRLFIKEYPTKQATVQTIRTYLDRLRAVHSFSPDILVVDYADLLRAARQGGEKRHELESTYEDLRALGQELDIAIVTADQTNRGGLNKELVTIEDIGEAYAKAQVCDLIMTISRSLSDKSHNGGKLFVAKSRLGYDGMWFPFHMDPSTVKVTVMDKQDNAAELAESSTNVKDSLTERFRRFEEKKRNREETN